MEKQNKKNKGCDIGGSGGICSMESMVSPGSWVRPYESACVLKATCIKEQDLKDTRTCLVWNESSVTKSKCVIDLIGKAYPVTRSSFNG